MFSFFAIRLVPWGLKALIAKPDAPGLARFFVGLAGRGVVSALALAAGLLIVTVAYASGVGKPS